MTGVPPSPSRSNLEEEQVEEPAVASLQLKDPSRSSRRPSEASNSWRSSRLSFEINSFQNPQSIDNSAFLAAAELSESLS